MSASFWNICIDRHSYQKHCLLTHGNSYHLFSASSVLGFIYVDLI